MPRSALRTLAREAAVASRFGARRFVRAAVVVALAVSLVPVAASPRSGSRLAPYAPAQNKSGRSDGPAEMTVAPRTVDYAVYHANVNNFEDCVLDSAGNLFAVGAMETPAPTTAGAYDTTFDNRDVIVAKYSPAGILLAATYLGGSGGDAYPSIAIGPDDNPVIVVYTNSPNFPTTDGSTNVVGLHVAVAKLSSNLSTLVWSTALPAGFPVAAAADAAGAIYFVGEGTVDWPVTAGAYDTDSSGGAHFLTNLTDAGVLSASTYAGDYLALVDVAVDTSGRPVVAGVGVDGVSLSSGAYDTTFEDEDVVVAIYSTDLKTRPRATALGSYGNDSAFAVAVNSSNQVVVYGAPGSSSFPVTAGVFNDYWHANKNFIAKLDATLSSLLWSAFPGGDESVVSYGKDIGFDTEGDVVFLGNTTGFPVTPDAIDSTPSPSEGFVAIASGDGSTLKYATYLGSPGGEVVGALALGSGGIIAISGASPGGGPWPVIGYGQRGGANGFVTRFSIAGPGPACQFHFAAQSYSVFETSGGTSVTLTVERTGPCSGAASVKYNTFANTASAGTDFTAVSGTLSFPTGVTARTISVPILDDTTDESNESFVVRLNTPSTGNALGQYRAASVTVYDADSAGSFEFSDPVYYISEPAGPITITVYRIGDASGPASVKYSSASATATSGSDFPAIPATILNFADGQTSATFQVSATDDALQEGVEMFDITLSSPSGRAALGKQSKALVHILDNEAP